MSIESGLFLVTKNHGLISFTLFVFSAYDKKGKLSRGTNRDYIERSE